MDGKTLDHASDDFDTALQAAVAANDTVNSNAGGLTSTALATVTSGWADSEIAVVNLQRIGANGGDTMTDTAELVMVKIEYTVDQESD